MKVEGEKREEVDTPDIDCGVGDSARPPPPTVDHHASFPQKVLEDSAHDGNTARPSTTCGWMERDAMRMHRVHDTVWL